MTNIKRRKRFRITLMSICMVCIGMSHFMTACTQDTDAVPKVDYADETYRQIKIGSKEITLPAPYKTFEDNGFSFESNKGSEELEGLGHSDLITLKNKKGDKIKVRIVNRRTKPKPASSCEVFYLEVEEDTLKSDIKYKDIEMGTLKRDVLTSMATAPVSSNDTSLDKWIMDGYIDGYKAGGKITIKYKDNSVTGLVINCSYTIE